MKSKKLQGNRKGTASRLIVDEYDLIQYEPKEEHSLCKFCQ